MVAMGTGLEGTGILSANIVLSGQKNDVEIIFQSFLHTYTKEKKKPNMVGQSCNPSYLGGRKVRKTRIGLFFLSTQWD
jgi:ribosome biogenesis protein Nip4